MITLADELGHLSYVVEGDGPPVVLVHPGIADHHVWDAVVPALAERYSAIRYDLRGFGESGVPAGPFSEVDDLRRLVDHLGCDRVRLAGSSWGARVALEFAHAHPNRVESLALFSPPWPRYPWSAEMIAFDEVETTALAAGDVDGAVAANLDMLLRGPSRSWGEVGEGLADLLRGSVRTALLNQDVVGEFSTGPTAIDLGAVSVPTLVGVGVLDVADFQDIARRYVAGIPGAVLVEFAAAAHLVTVDTPDELAAALLRFF